MSEKFINWIDKKGVPIMTFVVSTLLTVFVIVQLLKLLL
jgi:amino acid permease